MPAVRIPGTSKIIFLPAHCGDHVFNMRDAIEADIAIKQEDIMIYGDWRDYDGSGTRSAQAVMTAGQQNQFGNDVILMPEHAHLGDLTVRGNNADVTRQRNRLITLEVKDE